VRLQKDVNVYLHYPSGKFYQIVVELKNVPGALHDFLGVLLDLNLNILGSFSSVDAMAKTGVWSGFVEDSQHSAAELKRRISSSTYVLDSVVVESKDGFLVDGVHFPFAFNTGDRAIMMRSKFVGAMLSSVRKQFGSGGDVIIYEEGRAYGLDVWADYVRRLGAGFLRSNLQETMKIYQALGWFRLESVDQSLRDGSITIRTSDSFECEGVKSEGPHCQFVRGHLSGGLTTIMGEEVACKETKCIAAGDKYCEFVLRPKSGAFRQR
jgi:predicted hydrocarbon binding protein